MVLGAGGISPDPSERLLPAGRDRRWRRLPADDLPDGFTG